MNPLSFQFLSTVRLGIKSLMLHKLRSVLTMLGIIFGVCSVIAMLAIGEGASYEAQEAIKKLGSHNIIIRSLKPPDDAKQSGLSRGIALEYGLTYDDGARIQSTIPGVVRVLPMRIIRENVRFARNSVPCQIIGTLPFYTDIVGLDIVRGRFLTETDELNHENVCVLTAGLAQRLFPYQDPLDPIRQGRRLLLPRGRPGAGEEHAGAAHPGRQDGGRTARQQRLYPPQHRALPLRRDAHPPHRRQLRGREGRTAPDSPSRCRTWPRSKPPTRRSRPCSAGSTSKTDYETIVPLQLLRQAEQTKRIFNIVLGSIAAISLLVGGIGIMNIMLATVTERTREIGIRRALGAKRRDITMQFLVETVVLSVGGGLIGVVVGVIVPLVVSQLTTMRTIVTLWSVLLAFGISGAVGIIFGLYPAKAAAQLDPIEALRHE